MQPLLQSTSNNELAQTVSPISEKLLDLIENKYYTGSINDENIPQKSSQSQSYTAKTKQSNIPYLIHQQQTEVEMPQIINIHQTQSTRHRHSVLKHAIQSTIQQLLYLYKNTNTNISPQQQQTLKNQIFQRFAFIYSEMNEVKGDIQNAINFLNEGVNLAIRQKHTPGKTIHLPHGRITQKSQSYEESSEMKEEDQGINEENSDQNYGQASLEERCQDKPNEQSMEHEE